MGSRAKSLVVVVAAAAILLAVSFAEATVVLFQNRGTLSGWDSIIKEHNGDVQEIASVVEAYKGNTSILCTQVYDPTYTGTYHSEVAKNGSYQRGDIGVYGFAFKLQSPWDFTSPQRFNLAEFIADFSGSSGCGGYIPTSMVWLVGKKLYSQVKSGPVCSPTTTTFPNLTMVSAGDWHTIVIQAYWTSGSTGYYRLWFDGVNVLDSTNIATTLADDRPFQFRVGIVATDWHDQGKNVGPQTTRRVWYDQIGIGIYIDDADPTKWT